MVVLVRVVEGQLMVVYYAPHHQSPCDVPRHQEVVLQV